MNGTEQTKLVEFRILWGWIQLFSNSILESLSGAISPTQCNIYLNCSVHDPPLSREDMAQMVDCNDSSGWIAMRLGNNYRIVHWALRWIIFQNSKPMVWTCSILVALHKYPDIFVRQSLMKCNAQSCNFCCKNITTASNVIKITSIQSLWMDGSPTYPVKCCARWKELEIGCRNNFFL